MTWTEHALLAFDVESTGVDTYTDRIVTASLVWRCPDQELRVREWLLNPGVPIPAGATEVHGITTDHAAEHGMDPGLAVFEITGIIGLSLRRGTPLVVMNAAFDLSMLDSECRRYDVDPLDTRLDRIGPVLDPLVIDRALREKRGFGGRKLPDLCDWYGVVQHDAHQSTGDCEATLDVLLAMAAGFPDLAARDPWEIHDRSVVWHQEWSATFARFLESKGKHDHDVDGVWPVRPPRDGDAAVGVPA